MTRIVYRMRDRGLVTINTSQEDGRVSVVSPTAKGLTLRQKAWKLVKQSTNETFKGMKIDKIDDLNTSLSLIFDQL